MHSCAQRDKSREKECAQEWKGKGKLAEFTPLLCKSMF